MNIKIPDIKVPIIKNGHSDVSSLSNEFKNKKVVLFAVPGAFTPTCSEQHFPGYIKLYKEIISKGIDDIYCLSVNDKYVMKSWLISQKVSQGQIWNLQYLMLVKKLCRNTLKMSLLTKN